MASREILESIAIAIGVAVAAAGTAYGIHAVVGEVSPGDTPGPIASASPRPTADAEPWVSPSPSLIPSPSPTIIPSPSPTIIPSPSPETQPAAAPAPKTTTKPTNTAFGGMWLNVVPTSPYTVGEPHVYLQGEIRLASGATVSCRTTMGGTTWPSATQYIGQEWVGNYHVLAVSFDIVLDPADYPYTTTCTTSDGVTWSESGTATQDRFIGVGATWP